MLARVDDARVERVRRHSCREQLFRQRAREQDHRELALKERVIFVVRFVAVQVLFIDSPEFVERT